MTSSEQVDDEPVDDGRRRRRNRRGEGERLRDDLVEAAVGLLSEVTDAGQLSIRQVAARAGVTAPAVYLHFPDKESLLRAAGNEQFARFRKALVEGASASADPVQSFYLLGRAYLRFAREFPGHYEALFCTAQLTAEPDDFTLDVPAREDQQGKAALQDAEALLRWIHAELAITGIDAQHATFFAWTALHGIVHQQRKAPLFPWPDDEVLIGFVARGCGLPPAQA